MLYRRLFRKCNVSTSNTYADTLTVVTKPPWKQTWQACPPSTAPTKTCTTKVLICRTTCWGKLHKHRSCPNGDVAICWWSIHRLATSLFLAIEPYVSTATYQLLEAIRYYEQLSERAGLESQISDAELKKNEILHELLRKYTDENNAAEIADLLEDELPNTPPKSW